MIIGLVIKYAGGIHKKGYTANCTIPSAKDTIWIEVENGTRYSYTLNGPVFKAKGGGELQQRVTILHTSIVA
jgi:hypothetical protein